MPRATKNRSAEHDAYIAAAREFARPILRRLRDLFHQACPEIQETMKWNFPHFEHRGIVGSMAAFKQYVSFGFWKESLMKDSLGLFQKVGKTSMGMARLTALSELPDDATLLAYIAEAVALNESGAKVPRSKSKKRGGVELPVPDDLAAGLKRNRSARETFENFSPSHRKEYIAWITEAKRDETRQKRLATTLKWLSEEKPHNWRYLRK